MTVGKHEAAKLRAKVHAWPSWRVGGLDAWGVDEFQLLPLPWFRRLAEWYDLQEDPHELINLAMDRSRRNELRTRFDELRAIEEVDYAPIPS